MKPHLALRSLRSGFITVVAFAFHCMSPSAAEELADVPGLLRSAIGVTRNGTVIDCWVHRDDFDLNSKQTRVLLIGGLAGEQESANAVRAAIRWFYTSPDAAPLRERFSLSAVPVANPDGLVKKLGPQNGSGGDPTRGYPLPQAAFYGSASNPEAAYLWRWMGMHAPDLVLDVRAVASTSGNEVRPDHQLLRHLLEKLPSARNRAHADELTVQLQQIAPSETGKIPALKIVAEDAFLKNVLQAAIEIGWNEASPARLELQRRLDRSPLAVAEQLSRTYGHTFSQVMYIPAVAMIGRLRYGELVKDDRQRADVDRLVAPYLMGKEIATKVQGSSQAGHLIFCELADRSTGELRSKCLELARSVADLAFDDQGRPLEAMPSHLEMSDALFMSGPVLAHVGALTGERRYFDACLRHLRFMRGLCLRQDGIYRHSPLDETAWGRGNGFPALGIALCLSKFPAEHPGQPELLTWFQAHMQSLLKHQDPTGCWHQVIDRPESYRELTATCMIGFAMARGMREGWLRPEDYRSATDLAWYAVKTRVAANGRLVDVCTGTGKQKSLRDYYDRPAILGPDDRGGAMALLFATEMASATDK